jgi:hypothetical protein
LDKYQLHISKEIDLPALESGLFIFMFRATRIPPHLGIIVGGKLYDIATAGPNLGIPVEQFYNTALKRGSEVVFIELIKPMIEYPEDIILNKVRQYWKVTPETSCLNPIKDFLQESFDLEGVNKVDFAFELIPQLQEKNIVNSIAQVGLSNKLKNSDLELYKYTKEDIEKCINALSRKEHQSC